MNRLRFIFYSRHASFTFSVNQGVHARVFYVASCSKSG